MEVNLLSLNLWEGGKVVDQIFPFIQEVNADVMCLQEAIIGGDRNMAKNTRTVEVLAEMFPDYDSFFSPEVRKISGEDNDLQFGNLILSRWPIVERGAWFFDQPYHNAWIEGVNDNTLYPSSFQKVEIDCAGQPLHVLNVHGIWGWDGFDNPRRDRMSEMIIQEVAGRDPVILAGDFNCFPETQAIGRIEEHLVSVFGRVLPTTFNVKYKTYGNFATSVVDMVLVSRSMEILSKECLQVDVSDHLPLQVRMRI